MSHMVSVIADLLHNDCGCCLDPECLKMILESGELGSVGVGVASGLYRGAVAAKCALECLFDQGVKTSETTGAVICVEVPAGFPIKDIEDVSMTIDDHFAANADVIVGTLINNRLRSNLKVTIMTISRH